MKTTLLRKIRAEYQVFSKIKNLPPHNFKVQAYLIVHKGSGYYYESTESLRDVILQLAKEVANEREIKRQDQKRQHILIAKRHRLEALKMDLSGCKAL